MAAFELQHTAGLKCGSAAGDVDRWNADIRMAPREMLAILGRDLPGATAAEVAFFSGREGRLRLDGPLPDGSRWHATRSFDLSRGRIEHDLFTVPEAYRGKGIGLLVLRNSLDLYERIGIDSILLRVDGNSAGSTGGYAWARMGFLPTAAAWTPLQQELTERLAALPLPAAARSEAAALIADSDPAAVRAIAALKAPVNGTTLGKALLVPASWEAGRMSVRPGSGDRAVFDAYLAERLPKVLRELGKLARPSAPRRSGPSVAAPA